MSPSVTLGAELPVLVRTPDPVDLFSFSAAAWLLHRIHYDVPFSTEHDGHPALLVHGPLQGMYMIQTVQWWLGTNTALRKISYRHATPAYVNDTLTCGGSVTALDPAGGTFDTELWVKKSDGTVTTSGTATFTFPASAEPVKR